jgi:short-subunit dehydrogenase
MTYTALITGASSGIGEATARRLAQERGVALILVARRRDRMEALATQLESPTTIYATDLTDPSAGKRLAAAIDREHGGLNLLVNNAGASWRGSFADKGWANVERHMRINFEAQVRLTEALLPLMRETALAVTGSGRRHGTPSPAAGGPPDLIEPVAIVNVASTAARVSRPNAGAYSASKFALAGWSDALYAEERPNRVHVGLVLPGFVQTEGFPANELRAHPLLRHIVSTPDRVAEAILDAGPRGKAERYVPRYYWIAAAARVLMPTVVRRATSGGRLTTSTQESRLDR